MNVRDLDKLDRLLARASAVVPMRDVHEGNRDATVIGMRHDVDENGPSLETALRMAEWEHGRGYRSTYFLLHDSVYWQDAPAAARELVALGHEVGLHVNAIAVALRTRRGPHEVLTAALHELRRAVEVVGCVAHGDRDCYGPDGTLRFVNDEVFMECERPTMGAPDRVIDGQVRLSPRSLWDYGLKYEANHLARGDYVSDSGGAWNPARSSLDEASLAWPSRGQLHLLVHPDWWAGVFDLEPVAA